MNRIKKKLVANAYLLLTAAVLVSVLGIGIAVIKLDRDNYISFLRRDVEQALHSATDRIQLSFFQAVLMGKNIENILSMADKIDAKRIDRVVEEFQNNNPSVIAVGLAPDLVLTHSFPQKNSNNAIGTKYWQVPDQMASVALAYRRNSPVVDGPVALIQGGTGYILRYPVFLPNAALDIDQFWGIISIVIKVDDLLNPQSSDLGGYVFDMYETDAAQESAALATPTTDFELDQPVRMTFSMLGGQWAAAVYPAKGWPAYSPQSRNLLGIALFLGCVLVAVLWVFRSLALKTKNAHALLAETIDSIDEGFIAFDERERVMIVNQKYLDYHPEIADLIKPGIKLQQLLDVWFDRKTPASARGNKADWVRDRLNKFRDPGTSFLQHISDDLWLKVTEAKTPHGYTVGIWTDVSAEKRAQEAAELADREKTEFLNNVSHELRTPLTVIFGRASFMENNARLPQAQRVMSALELAADRGPELTTAVAAYQEFVSEQGAKIASTTQHMIRLVEDLLDWTKVSRGQIELEIEPVEATEIAEMVVQDLQPNAAAKGLTLELSAEAPVMLMADKTRLRQILYNLVINAIKFTAAGHVRLSLTYTDGRAVFDVSDTGCGIAPENVDCVFQRFKQVDGSMSRQNGGLGLGLAISQELAKLHHGTLSLTSTVGVGSTFTLCLPQAAHVVELREIA